MRRSWGPPLLWAKQCLKTLIGLAWACLQYMVVRKLSVPYGAQWTFPSVCTVSRSACRGWRRVLCHYFITMALWSLLFCSLRRQMPTDSHHHQHTLALLHLAVIEHPLGISAAAGCKTSQHRTQTLLTRESCVSTCTLALGTIFCLCGNSIRVQGK